MSAAVQSSRQPEAASPAVAPEIVTALGPAIKRNCSTRPEARAISVTSTRRGEDRSTDTAGPPFAMARTLGRQAVLVDLDTDTRRIPAGQGGRGDAPDDPANFAGYRDVVEWINPDLGILMLGTQLEALERTGARPDFVIAEVLAHGYDVVADLSCLSCLRPTGSADVFSHAFDVSVLVVRAGATPASAARSVAQVLPDAPVVLLNRTHSFVPNWFPFRGARSC